MTPLPTDDVVSFLSLAAFRSSFVKVDFLFFCLCFICVVAYLFYRIVHSSRDLKAAVSVLLDLAVLLLSCVLCTCLHTEFILSE